MVNSLKLSPGELQDVSPELQAESMISSQSPTSIQNRPLNLPFQAPPVQLSPHHSSAQRDRPDSFLALWLEQLFFIKIQVSDYN